MIYLSHNQGTPDRREAGKIADHPSKTAWERDNVIQVVLKVNRNRDPELFELLQQAESKSGTVRALLRQAISEDK